MNERRINCYVIMNDMPRVFQTTLSYAYYQYQIETKAWLHNVTSIYCLEVVYGD